MAKTPLLYYFPPAPTLATHYREVDDSYAGLDNSPNPSSIAGTMECLECGQVIPVVAERQTSEAGADIWRLGHIEICPSSRARLAAHLAEKHGIKED